MDEVNVQKNILDLKYNTSISFALKSLGLGFTLLLGLIGFGASVDQIKLFTMLGILFWELSLVSFLFFQRKASLRLRELRNLENM